MSELVVVAITTVYSVLVVVDLLGNSLVCLIITTNRDMRYFLTIYMTFLSLASILVYGHV